MTNAGSNLTFVSHEEYARQLVNKYPSYVFYIIWIWKTGRDGK